VSFLGDIKAQLQLRLASNVTPDTNMVEVMSSDSYHALVSFPTPWTSRIQTPVRRVPPGKNWSGQESWYPETYGGPGGVR
jgi:hypothetical protein